MAGNLWLRIGDGGEYEHYGQDFSAAAGVLREFGASPPLYWRGMGFECDQFRGNDYVSCFWGDDDAQPIRDLDREEREALQRAIAGRVL